MPDNSYYNALNAHPDYATRRRDAMQNLLIAEKMRDAAMQQLQDRYKAMGLVANQLTESAKMQSEMLPADAERFKVSNEKWMNEVINELGKYNNDPNMLQLMTPQVISKYQRNLIGSEELRDAKQNQQNYALGSAAIQKGDLVQDVEVEYPGGTKEKVPWLEAVDLHAKGVIKKLPFTSSMPVAEINPLKFLAIEMPKAERAGRGKVSVNYLADLIQAENPRYTKEQAMQQAKLHADPQNPEYTNFLWGNIKPHGYGGGLTPYQNMQFQQRLQSVKSITDNLHRALFDPSMKGEYDPTLNAFTLNTQPINITGLKKGTGKNASQATDILVQNDPVNPTNSRFIIRYDDDTADYLTFDDLAQRIIGSSNNNLSDYTLLNQYINQDGTSIYNPIKYAQANSNMPFDATLPEDVQQQPLMNSMQEVWNYATQPHQKGGKKIVPYLLPQQQQQQQQQQLTIEGW